jgi:tripartite-type tricarboxylate transporter receptor subunit TctC
VSPKTLAAFVFLLCAGQAVAETRYPERAVTVIVPFGAGGGSDTIFRAVAEELRTILGRPFVVENRTGADGILGLETAHKARSDGYTLLVGNGISNGSTPLLDKEKISFDVDAAFDVVSPLADGPPTILTSSNADLPATDLKGLIAYIKNNPGKVRYGSPGIGSSPHLDIIKLARQEGLDMVHMPSVAGGGQLLHDLTSGDLHISFVNAATVAPYIRAGTLTGLAVVGSRRLDGLDVPTFEELGFPDIGTMLWHALFAPAGTPDEIKQKLFSAVQEALQRPKVKTLMKHSYFFVPHVETRADAEVWCRAAQARVRGLIQETPPSALH